MAYYRGRDNINKRIVKTEALFSERSRSFVFHFRPLGLKIDGKDMTAVNFQANAGADITFTFDGAVYTFAKADVEIVRRLRSRRYALEPSAVAIV